MSLNDTTILNETAKGSTIYPGVANPTVSSGTVDPMSANFVQDPTTPAVGAGAGKNFHGDRDAKQALKNSAGVVEARPGIIESSKIEPLDEDKAKGSATSRFPTTGKNNEPSLVTKIVDTVLGK